MSRSIITIISTDTPQIKVASHAINPTIVQQQVTTIYASNKATEAYCVVPGSSIFGTWEMVAA